MKEEPAATYQGTTAGFAATQAPAGTPFRLRTSDAIACSRYLRGQHLSVLSSVGRRAVISHSETVINGFSTRLTPAEAAALQLNPSVAAVAEDQIVHPTTVSTPRFLGLTAPGGLWSQTDAKGSRVLGEDMVLGDVDLGIWPESPSYADHVDSAGLPTFSGGTQAYGPPPTTWTGTCVAGEAFAPATACNIKLIGVAKLGSAIQSPALQPAATASGNRTFTVQTRFAGKLGLNKGIKEVTLGAATTLTPTPATVYAGGTATVGMVWSGLAASRYVGAAQFLDSAGSPAAVSPVYIDTTPGAPLEVDVPADSSKRQVARQ